MISEVAVSGSPVPPCRRGCHWPVGFSLEGVSTCNGATGDGASSHTLALPRHDPTHPPMGVTVHTLTFHLEATPTEGAVPATNPVAHGVRFPDGTCALRWRNGGTAIYPTIADLRDHHAPRDTTQIVWDRGPGRRSPFLAGREDFRNDLACCATYDSIGGEEGLKVWDRLVRGDAVPRRAYIERDIYDSMTGAHLSEWLLGYADAAQEEFGGGWRLRALSNYRRERDIALGIHAPRA